MERAADAAMITDNEDTARGISFAQRPPDHAPAGVQRHTDTGRRGACIAIGRRI